MGMKTLNRLKRISWMKVLQRTLTGVIAVSIGYFVLVTLLFESVRASYQEQTFNYDEVQSVEHKKVAIIFGAGLSGDLETPSEVLKDRVRVGVDLYEAGKADILIMSGDNRYTYYDEPTAMINYAKSLGVPEKALQADYAGRRTYDTCVRAKQIFGVDDAILVTQEFHMARAMYICERLGVSPVGVTADRQEYENHDSMVMREHLAFSLAVWELNVNPPDNVVLGDTIDIE